MENKIIVKVWKNKSNGQKLITVPANCNIQEGDYVFLNKLEK